jgi:CHAD domain-containing protein
MYQIQAREESGDAVKRVIVEEIDSVIALLTDPEGDQDLAVHESRKSLKRIRAALRLVRGEIGEEVFGHENAVYRDTGRQIAILRDSAVMVETLDLIRTQNEASLTAESFELVRQRLVEQKEETQQYFLRQTAFIPNMVETLAEACERVAGLPIQHQDFRAYEGGLRRVYQRGRLWMARTYQDGNSPQKFHEWRKRVKYTWHHIEFLQPLWPALFETLANEMHQLSDYLGEAHDAAVLAAYIQENKGDFADEPELVSLLTRLSERQQALEVTAQPLGRRLYAERPKAFVERLSAYWKR